MGCGLNLLIVGCSTLENDKDQQHKIQIKSLQDRIRSLEVSTQNELSEKARVLDSLAHERGKTYKVCKYRNKRFELKSVHFNLKSRRP